MIGIYKIVSPSNKIYIGQSININQRWDKYKNFMLGGSNSIGSKIYNSLQKYGFDQHQFEIIEECEESQLDEREIYWIKFYNSVGEGLNIKEGGLGGRHNEETKQKMSISHQIKLTNKNIFEKRKINCKLAANKHGVQEKSIKNTDWIKRNKNLRKKIAKIVLQYDLEDNFIKEWECAFDIQKEIKGIWSTEISKICRENSNKIYKGFKWKYKNLNELKTKKYNNILQFDLENNFIKEWNNTGEIVKELKLSRSNLYKCLNGDYKTFGGFRWILKQTLVDKQEILSFPQN